MLPEVCVNLDSWRESPHRFPGRKPPAWYWLNSYSKTVLGASYEPNKAETCRGEMGYRGQGDMTPCGGSKEPWHLPITSCILVMLHYFDKEHLSLSFFRWVNSYMSRVSPFSASQKSCDVDYNEISPKDMSLMEIWRSELWHPWSNPVLLTVLLCLF